MKNCAAIIFHRSLEHALSNAGYCAANLSVALVGDEGDAVSLFDIDISVAFQKAWLTFAFDYHAKMMRGPQVLQPNVAGEDTFDRAYTSSQGRRIGILTGLLQALASGDAPLQNTRVNQSLIDSLDARLEFM